MQCAAGAAATLAGASGIRAWLAVRSPAWFTGRIAKLSTAALLAVAVIAAGLISA